MHIKACGVGGPEDRLGASHFRCRAVRHHQKAIGFQGGLVLDDAVLRDADAIERRAKRAHPTNDDSVFNAGDRDGGEISKYDDMPHDGYRQEQSAKEQAPETAPECTALAPKLDPVTRVIKADDLFVSVIALSDDAKIFHLEAGCSQLLHGCFRCFVVCEYGDD